MRISPALLIGTSVLALATPASPKPTRNRPPRPPTRRQRVAGIDKAKARSSSPRPSAHRGSRTCPSRSMRRPRRTSSAPTHDHRGHQPQRRRPHRPEPRPGPEPGFDPRRLRRPDRPRPAGREGTGRRLSRRKRHLAVAVHARLRPVRPQPRRDPARPAGHTVRLGLGRRHASATSPTSRSSARPKAGRR